LETGGRGFEVVVQGAGAEPGSAESIATDFRVRPLADLSDALPNAQARLLSDVGRVRFTAAAKLLTTRIR
jgi:hypothetical protein